MAEKVSGKKLQAHVNAALDQTQLEKLAARLVDKRQELAERIVNLEQQIVVKDGCSLLDVADAAYLQENRLRAGKILEQDRQVIKEIDDALHRLSNGHYGVDQAMGEPIGYERLKLIPWARTNAAEEK